MDLSAAVEGSFSEETERLNGLATGHDTQSLEGNGTDGPSRDEHQFQKAIAAWRSIDLSSLVPQLDKTTSEIVENQRESLVQRKELAQKTKNFRKLDDEAKLNEYKTLLKAYQSFVDLLTNHGKTTSSAFLQLYSTISEAPDPYPLLEASVDSLLISEDTLPKVTAENERLQKSVRNLTHDLDKTERRLTEERTVRKKLEVEREARSKEIEASWQAVLAEKKENWEAKERALEEKVDNQDRLLKEIKASYEVSQRLGHNDEDKSHHASVSAAELEIVSSDLERTSQRLAEVETRNELLRVELAQASSSVPQRTDIEDDPTVTRLRSDNASLRRKLDAMKFEKDSDLRKWESRIRSLERDLQSLQQDREELRDKVYQWRDYTDIKRELEVFKAVEFSTGDDDDAAALTEASERAEHRRSASQTNGAVVGNKKDSLEQMLLARNKKLSSEMAVLRVAHQELQRELQQLQQTVSSTSAELERTQALNATLENDLVTLQQEASNQFPSSARSTTSRYPISAGYASSQFASRTRKSSPTSSIISGVEGQRTPFADTLEAIRAGEAVGGGSGILPMVQAQRDRFRQKNSQLETELAKQYGLVSSLRQEVASLQKDNLSLYEKTRYVSTYQRNVGPPASSASAYMQDPPGTVIQMSSDAPLDKYRSAYEARISPFAAFRGRESTRAYRRLSLPERAIFSVTRLVLATRVSRNLFAAYCVALHLLLFTMLYSMQAADGSGHAAHLGNAMLTAGGGVVAMAADGHDGDWHEEALPGGRPG